MRVTINDDIKVVQFWCGNEDYSDSSFDEHIDKLFAAAAPSSSYRKVIFRSGDRDLSELTSSLLHHNAGLR